MKKFIFHNKLTILLLFIIAFAAFLRLWMLGQVPSSLTDDEIREVMSAYSLIHTGRDLFGNFLPLTFNMESVNFGPVSIYIASIFLLFSDLGNFIGRFPYALVSIVSVLLTYFLSLRITSNKIMAILSAFAMSISVWDIQISRVAMDPSFSMFFYLLGINWFLRIKKNNYKNLLLSLIFMVLGFYSYAATKVIFLPFILLLGWYKWPELNRKQVLTVIIFILFTFGSFAFLAKTQNAAQYDNAPFFFMDTQQTATGVELERRASEAPGILKTLYHNKLTYWYKTFVDQYVYAFSPEFLFTKQESNGIFSTWDRGEMYVFESILILAGSVFLFLKKRKELVFTFLMIASSVLPSGLGVHTPTYVIRSELMIPFLYVLVGTGIYSISYFVKNNNLKKVFYLLLVILYIYSFGGYLTQYYYDWSRTHSDYFTISTKNMVLGASSYSKDGKKVIVSGARPVTVLQYAFYNKVGPNNFISKIDKFPLEIGNVTFYASCLIQEDNPFKVIPQNTVYIAASLCKYKTKPSYTINSFNHGVDWNIYLRK